MRSVYVFVRATADELRAHLDKTIPRSGNVKQWLYPGSYDTVLYIEEADNLYDELEPETVNVLLTRFGERARCLGIDVSRRHHGEREVREVVSELLHTFDGIAMDDHSDHLWELDEIKTGQAHNGVKFFIGDN
jgi:hypothetical protein